MIPGESPQVAAARHVTGDTNINIHPGDLKFFNLASYVWSMREQAPQHNGTADVALIFYVVLSESQEHCVKNVHSSEYEILDWMLLSDVINDHLLHAALRDNVKALQNILSG